MKIIISNSSTEPIYTQIYNQLKDQIIRGVLKEGDLLPSIRALAKSLRVSVITVKRAYQDLNKDGFIETTVGKGTFVKKINNDFYLEEKKKEIESLLLQAISLANQCNISEEEILETLQFLYESENYDG